jgi:hypothetical protein
MVMTRDLCRMRTGERGRTLTMGRCRFAVEVCGGRGPGVLVVGVRVRRHGRRDADTLGCADLGRRRRVVRVRRGQGEAHAPERGREHTRLRRVVAPARHGLGRAARRERRRLQRRAGGGHGDGDEDEGTRRGAGRRIALPLSWAPGEAKPPGPSAHAPDAVPRRSLWADDVKPTSDVMIRRPPCPPFSHVLYTAVCSPRRTEGTRRTETGKIT